MLLEHKGIFAVSEIVLSLKGLQHLRALLENLDFSLMRLEHIHKIKFGAGSFLPLNLGQKT
jgi:hypothetical protein